ncbi:protein mab-21-like [Mytilus edulis]|uniref:protein mab-21-like n=1 Tax=Mytilus edulis TaxID=6550 RepID=UPI0039EEE8F4
MDLRDKNLSLQFYDYLCNIVGSEDVVKTRREIFTAKDISDNAVFGNYISSGSKAEGLDLVGSDFDIMVLLNFIRVYENLDDIQSNSDKLLLVMETYDTKPGFAKLKLANKSLFVYPMYDMFDTVGESMYLSSKLLRESNLPDCLVIHGPCHSTANGLIEITDCLRCEKWITSAQQWIHRSRTAWPDNMLVTAAVQYGVLFVPIGCKHSPNEDLQWRISFSVTEKMLIHSFTHTQLLCYALLKIILKDLIKARHEDLLCSYFLKTIMFWLSEEISPSEWKPENMISCFLDCIRRLVYCVEYKTCLHYFIPENNLFEDRFTDNRHKELLETLRSIYRSPWIYVFHTKTFKQFLPGSVGLTYGRKMMIGHLSRKGINVSEARVGKALATVNLRYHHLRQQQWRIQGGGGGR